GALPLPADDPLQRAVVPRLLDRGLRGGDPVELPAEPRLDLPHGRSRPLVVGVPALLRRGPAGTPGRARSAHPADALRLTPGLADRAPGRLQRPADPALLGSAVGDCRRHAAVVRAAQGVDVLRGPYAPAGRPRRNIRQSLRSLRAGRATNSGSWPAHRAPGP